MQQRRRRTLGARKAMGSQGLHPCSVVFTSPVPSPAARLVGEHAVSADWGSRMPGALPMS